MTQLRQWDSRKIFEVFVVFCCCFIFFFGFQGLSKIKEQENFTLKYGNFSFHSVHTQIKS